VAAPSGEDADGGSGATEAAAVLASSGALSTVSGHGGRWWLTGTSGGPGLGTVRRAAVVATSSIAVPTGKGAETCTKATAVTRATQAAVTATGHQPTLEAWTGCSDPRGRNRAGRDRGVHVSISMRMTARHGKSG
jgi:hypothetical protein